MKIQNANKLYNKIFTDKVINASQLENLHSVLLMMIKDIDKLCRENNLKYMLSGGSCLGAIRHKGFIPWDDDIDIMMYYQDMLSLHKLINQQLSNKYISVLPYSRNSNKRMMKIYLLGTIDMEIGDEGIPCNHEIFVDVFPIVSLPNSNIINKINAKLYYFSSRMFALAFESKYPSKTLLERGLDIKQLDTYYKKRRSIGAIARLSGHWFWKALARHLDRDRRGKTQYEGIPSGISYDKEIFEKDFFSQVIECDFEDTKLFIPKNYERYLTNLYKDYMKIPKESDRERHIATIMDFGIYKNYDGEKL